MNRLRVKARYWFSRWPLAHAIDRYSPRSCWADLVSWAMGSRPLREALGSDYCQQESMRNDRPDDRCYCGKWCQGRLVERYDTSGEPEFRDA